MSRGRYDWAAIQRYHDAGNERDACMAKYGFAIASWYKASWAGRLKPRSGRFVFDWRAVQEYYDAGNTFAECRAKFGFSLGAWSKAVWRGVISTRQKRFTLERILSQSRSRASIKKRLLEAGLLKNECDECGISMWRGQRLSIQLHHRNGNRDDHRLGNLLMLCPNCHSQTPTFAARNKKQLAQNARKAVPRRQPTTPVARSSKGRTAGSEPAYEGSNPSLAACTRTSRSGPIV